MAGVYARGVIGSERAGPVFLPYGKVCMAAAAAKQHAVVSLG